MIFRPLLVCESGADNSFNGICSLVVIILAYIDVEKIMSQQSKLFSQDACSYGQQMEINKYFLNNFVKF